MTTLVPVPTGGQDEASAGNDSPPLPHNIEAEQQLLGAILSANDVLDRVDDLVKPEHFFDPVHREIFTMAAGRIAKGLATDATTLKNFASDIVGLKELGGAEYLVKLQLAAIATSAARDYAQLIHDLAVRRELIALGANISERARAMRDDISPDEQIVEAESDLFKLASSGTTNRGFQSFLRALHDAVQMANAAHNRQGQLAGVSTGLTDLDRMLGGLHESDLLILAGRPSMGKTSLATNIAYNVAKAWKQGQKEDGSHGTIEGGVVGFFSLEMSSAQLAQRILSEAAEIPSELIRKGDLTEEEFQRYLRAAGELERCPLYIDDTPALPIGQVAARARRLKRSPQGLDLLVIDYLQLLRGSANNRDNRVNEISEITQGLKAIAKELNIPVIALSQLSRQVEQREDKRPQLSDLRESGSIEQDADVVMFVYRGEYYKEREKPGEENLEAMTKWQQDMEQLHGKAEVIIGKQRHGPVGSVELSFDGRYTRFGNLVKPWQQGSGDGF
ncbi:replicative DNA helicase [Roseibacterium beibuensis]|uniref:Replicative DNA helicase n=1 Tax=[Roseibacterium] beibuensis TaxID=1193142 RepID=A0ABP9LJA7_9RHOB|nr:replicative DNA helicase [Roseibacterium beibuensis]MCS6625869.1 replicative DNA helicase [Roseibacterium beibuensis]